MLVKCVTDLGLAKQFSTTKYFTNGAVKFFFNSYDYLFLFNKSLWLFLLISV